MLRNWSHIIYKITQQIWFTAVCYGLFGVFTALLGLFLKDFLPSIELINVGAEAVESILKILATSMLTVATFSLTTMVSAFGNASSSATPRVTQLLLEDQTAQRSLATFIGAFLYSIVGIVALATKSYGEQGRFILFISTILVIIVIVVTFFRWISKLSTLGLMNENIYRVKEATKKAILSYAQILQPQTGEEKSYFIPLYNKNTGYVVSINFKALDELCSKYDVECSIQSLPGRFLYPETCLLKLNKVITEEKQDELRCCFIVEDTRSFDQDPRFGLIVLSEVASKALSPGINDPGTAISVLNSGAEIFSLWHEVDKAQKLNQAKFFKNITICPLQTKCLFEDFFGPIMRDGASLIEVVLRSQKVLASLKNLSPDLFEEQSRAQAERGLEMAVNSLSNNYDKDKALSLFKKNWNSI